MHEQALLRDLVRKVDEVATAEGLRQVTRIRLWAGALSHVSASAIGPMWADVARGTRADGAELVVEDSQDLDDPRAGEIVLTAVEGVGDPAAGS